MNEKIVGTWFNPDEELTVLNREKGKRRINREFTKAKRTELVEETKKEYCRKAYA